MKQTFLVIILCMLVIVVKGNNPFPTYSSGPCYEYGIRFLSVQSLNDALKNEGLAEITPFAANFSIGGTSWHKKFVFNGKISAISARGKENSNITRFWAWGVSMDFGRPIWSNDKMFFYPYLTLSYIVPYVKTQQTTDAKSFGAVYNQSLLERSFYMNLGELDVALGIAYRVKLGKKHMMNIGGGYHFPLLRSSWVYIDKKIDFPTIDCRGWVIGITWSYTIKQKPSNNYSKQSL